jgi:hypothetical protein
MCRISQAVVHLVLVGIIVGFGWASAGADTAPKAPVVTWLRAHSGDRVPHLAKDRHWQRAHHFARDRHRDKLPRLAGHPQWEKGVPPLAKYRWWSRGPHLAKVRWWQKVPHLAKDRHWERERVPQTAAGRRFVATPPG